LLFFGVSHISLFDQFV